MRVVVIGVNQWAAVVWFIYAVWRVWALKSEGYVAWDEAATLIGRALAVSGFKAGISDPTNTTHRSIRL